MSVPLRPATGAIRPVNVTQAAERFIGSFTPALAPAMY